MDISQKDALDYGAQLSSVPIFQPSDSEKKTLYSCPLIHGELVGIVSKTQMDSLLAQVKVLEVPVGLTVTVNELT